MTQPPSGTDIPPPEPQSSPYQQQNVYVQQSAAPAASDAKGLLTALFDLKFHTFITPKIVKIVYVISIALVALTWLMWIIAGFSTDWPILGALALVIGPVFALVILAFIRMSLEFYFAIVRMSDDIHRTYNPNS